MPKHAAAAVFFVAAHAAQIVSASAGGADAFAIAAHAAEIVAADAGGDAPVWLKLIPAGEFSGRDGRGPYSSGGQEAMHAVIQATRRRAGTVDLVIDYDHQTLFAAVPQVGGRAPAAGWIKELEVRPEGIFGRIEWTAAAMRAIRRGEYRYLSPVYTHDQAGKVQLLISAGLTNVPNLDLTAVAARTLIDTGDDMKKIAEALGLAADANEAAVLAAIGSLTAAHSAVVTAAGLAANASTEAVVTAIQTARSAAPDPAKFVPADQVAAMQAQLATLQAGIVTDKAEAAVNKAIADGKLAPALKDWGLARAKADLKDFEAFAAQSPALVAPGGRVLPARTTDAVTLDDADVAVMRALGHTEQDFLSAKKTESH